MSSLRAVFVYLVIIFKQMNKIVLFLLNLSVVYCRCPTPEDLHPCSCDIIGGDPGIHCFGTNITKIPEILQQLNGTNFEELIIHNTSITTINDNSFGSVNFYEFIHISQNKLLKNIGLNAFKRGPKTLSIVGNEQLGANIIFRLIKNSEYSEKLDLRSNAITEIPSFAFKLNNSSANNRFKEINLDNNRIAKIDTNGLTFSSEIKIKISLKNNSLNEKSLQNKCFENNDSSVLNIDFSGNNFQKLPENIFRYYFNNKKNIMNFSENQFQCDCDMKWILSDKIQTQINDIQCNNFHNKSLFKLTEAEYMCLTNPTTLSTISTTMSSTKTCPLAEDINPCLCDENILSIKCDKNSINSELLAKIGINFKNQNIFRTLIISETNITFITRNTFIDIKVENILIENNYKFKSLDTKSFNDKQEINSFVLRNNSLFNDNNIFELLRNLNPNEIDLSRNALTEVPSEAFTSEDNQNDYRIKTLRLDYNRIETIGSNAFIGLTKLTHLSLDHNLIKSLEDLSLKLNSYSDRLFVSLKNNFLDNNSLSVRTIDIKQNSKLILHLDLNSFTTIKENVFSKLILTSNQNELNFFGNKFVCDCNMIWILNTTQQNILNVFCVNKNKSIYDLAINDLTCI